MHDPELARFRRCGPKLTRFRRCGIMSASVRTRQLRIMAIAAAMIVWLTITSTKS
jgi:hypothetical protein